MIKSTPEVATAAHNGQPNLNPPDDAVSATDVLKPGATGPSFTLAMRPAANSDGNADAVDTGTPAEAVPVSSDSSSSAVGNNLGVQIIEAPNGTGGDAAATASATPAPVPAPTPDNASTVPTITLQPAGGATATAAASSEPAAVTSETSGTTQATTGSGGGTIAQPTTQQQKADKADTKTESTSKKKKGIHKVIPF
jgi:hypothetical protein